MSFYFMLDTTCFGIVHLFIREGAVPATSSSSLSVIASDIFVIPSIPPMNDNPIDNWCFVILKLQLFKID